MFCTKCGKELSDDAAFCPACGTSTSDKPIAVPSEEETLKYILPIGRSGYAIAAGYLALFSVLFVFAPFALLFGILALRDIRLHPEKKGKGRAWFGIVMGALFTLLGLLVLLP